MPNLASGGWGNCASPAKSSRGTAPGIGLLISAALHGVVLACCAIGWSDDRTEQVAVTDVALVFESPDPDIQPTSSPPPPRPQPAKPASRRSQVPPAMESTAKAVPAAASVASSTFPPGGSATMDGAGEPHMTTAAPPAHASPLPWTDNPAPTYPVSARRAGREGRTILLAVVGVNGECREVTVAETSGTPSLDEAAMAAVRRWRFTPAMRPDPTAEAIIRVPVIFRLTPL